MGFEAEFQITTNRARHPVARGGLCPRPFNHREWGNDDRKVMDGAQHTPPQALHCAPLLTAPLNNESVGVGSS
jgi:hypothetical protein